MTNETTTAAQDTIQAKDNSEDNATSTDWQQDQSFPPPAAFAAQANCNDADIYARAESDPNVFWAEWARQLTWTKPFDTILEWNPPHAQWFLGGQLNVSVNCVDRHLTARGDKRAIVWEGEPGDERTLDL